MTAWTKQSRQAVYAEIARLLEKAPPSTVTLHWWDEGKQCWWEVTISCDGIPLARERKSP